MKKLNAISIFLIIMMLFSSCTKNNLVGVTNSNPSNGSITLKINGSTIPSDVQKIIAKLSRTNYDTLKTSIEVISDSLNVLSFEAVPIGKWHLNVDANNSEGKIIYSGETDITIIEDESVDVYLTLASVGSGFGNINIYIDWNEYPWYDFNGNPVLTNAGSIDGAYGYGNPKLILDNGVYKMWYKNLEANGVSTVSYAESNDGISWRRIGNGPVINLGQPGSWDAGAVTTGPVIKENGIYKMYYSGAVEAHQPWQIGLATSTDGINWEKYQNPVVSFGNGWDYSIGANSLIKIDSIYYLYYHAWEPPNNYREGLAKSVDGISWTKYDVNPILISTESWEGTGAYYCSILYEDGIFKMIYMNYQDNNMGFGKATSSDGINWVKDSSNPYFTGSNSANNWTLRPIYPCIINVGKNYRVYYNSSYTSANDMAIGFLTINKF